MKIQNDPIPSIQLSQTEVYYQLALSKVPQIGVLNARKLIKHFGSAGIVFEQKTRDLVQVHGLSHARASAIRNFNGYEAVDREFAFAEKKGIAILSFQETSFPQRLNHCSDGPVVLFAKGDADLNARRMISIVGTRHISDYGKQMARDLIESFKPYDISVVSGFAYGVDIHAHRACLEVGLPTIAVLGHGLDRIYPADHQRYVADMIASGALLSEFTTGTKPDRENFPMRNRIVAGMSDATIVVESGFSGGSIITADLANGYSRDVFAIPGRIGDERSAGCNRLIKTNRAALLESVKDLEYIMGWNAPAKEKAVQRSLFMDLTPDEERIVSALREAGPAHIDGLCLGLEMPMSTVLVQLLTLELKGAVKALPGKRYQAI